uniref:Alpha-carbonic anhydrase domain-containing protein n=1 Tax=Clastoptera arizonana TaxID=38151 RepID=A0A1B6C8Q8_9HEMI
MDNNNIKNMDDINKMQDDLHFDTKPHNLHCVQYLLLAVITPVAFIIMKIFWEKRFCKSLDRVKILLRSSNKLTYGYNLHNGPSVWKVCFPDSIGDNQSPINIDTECSISVGLCTKLKTYNWDTLPKSMSIQNTGVTVKLLPEWWTPCVPTISGGPLKDDIYAVNCILFRWGPNNYEGSEHTLNNNRFSLEIQISTTRLNSKNDNDCFKHNNVAIISIFCQATINENPYLNYVLNHLHKIKKAASSTRIQPFPLTFLKSINFERYYSYNGSLTFPPCTEDVTWIIFPDPISISAEQIARFRKLYNCDGDHILTNTRPVQPLNSRQILYYR